MIVKLLFSKSNDAFLHVASLINLRLTIFLQATGVCVAMVRGIDISKNDNEYYTRIADDVVSHKESNVVIYYGLEKQGKSVQHIV